MTVMQVIKRMILLLAIAMQLPLYAQEPAAADPLAHYTLYFPPYWEGADKQVSGLHARLSRRLYQQAGLLVEMESVPYARIHRLLLPDNVAIVAYGANAETDDRFLFPIPQTSIELRIYGLNAEPVDTLEPLEGKRIAIKRGFPLGGYADALQQEKYRTITTNSVEQAIRLLLLGRVDYIITLDDPFQKDVRKVNLEGHKIWSRTLEKLDGWPIAVVKAHPQARELYQKIKQAYQQLRDKGVVTYKNQRLLLTEDF